MEHKQNLRLAFALIVLAALTRLLPHPSNFTPIGAIGLFGAAYFQRRWLALLVPFAALFVSDLLLNNIVYRAYYPTFTWFTSGWIYGTFALVMLAGWLMLRRRVSVGNVLGASLTASLIFFLVTNFSVWLQSGMYPQTPAGLLACYTAGLPFLTNTVLGDLCFSAVLFGVYEWATRRATTQARA